MCILFVLLSSLITVSANNYDNNNFDSAYTIGKDYKITDEIPLYAPEDYTVDVSGNVWLVFLANGKSVLQTYSKEGNYLYGIELPFSGKYVLNIDQDNYLIVAYPNKNTRLKFTVDGVLTNRYVDEKKDSFYYNWTPIKHIVPFGQFKMEKVNGYVSIYLENSEGQILYFNKKSINGVLQIILIVLFCLACLFLIILIESIIYKIRKKDKLTNSYFFRFYKKLKKILHN